MAARAAACAAASRDEPDRDVEEDDDVEEDVEDDDSTLRSEALGEGWALWPGC